MNRRGFYAIMLIALLVYQTRGVDFTSVNLAWQYDLNFAVRMNHRVCEADHRPFIFLNVKADKLASWSFEFFAQQGYESTTHRILLPETLSVDTLRKSVQETLVRLNLPTLKENLLVIKLSRGDQDYYYDIGLKIGSLAFSSLYPKDAAGMPILENYINRSDFSIVGSTSYLAMKYPERFDMADPPMADMKPLAPQVQADTVFLFSNDQPFEKGFFYVLRKDSLSTTGITLLQTPPYFPEYRQLGELVESMFYLLSEQEKKAILNSRNLKQSFDSFWMNTYSTKSRARNAIRLYYYKVKVANFLFTNFKPGWKTDRGMAMIVYGMPDEVYRTNNLEEWYYDSGHAFEFTVISTFFSPTTYSLRRSRALEEQWFEQIAALRRSMNE